MGPSSTGGVAYHGAVRWEAPIVVSVLVAGEARASFALRWTNDVERAVLVTALGVLALDAGADAVAAVHPPGEPGEVAAVAVVTGQGVSGPAALADLVAPLQRVLPPNPGFRPLAVEVAAAQRNLAGCAVHAVG